MLDVHSPQDLVHTWTDFLIHIATIVIGLLIAVTGSGVALATNDAAVEVASTNSAVPRLVHRFLEVVIAPNGNYVASVEGDSPPGGSPPDIRELVVRRVADGSEVRVALPCGRVPQCWPSAPAWSPDSGHLSFALRTPGTHSYAVYDVTTASAHLTHLLTFNGTITLGNECGAQISQEKENNDDHQNEVSATRIQHLLPTRESWWCGR